MDVSGISARAAQTIDGLSDKDLERLSYVVYEWSADTQETKALSRRTTVLLREVWDFTYTYGMESIRDGIGHPLLRRIRSLSSHLVAARARCESADEGLHAIFKVKDASVPTHEERDKRLEYLHAGGRNYKYKDMHGRPQEEGKSIAWWDEQRAPRELLDDIMGLGRRSREKAEALSRDIRDLEKATGLVLGVLDRQQLKHCDWDRLMEWFTRPDFELVDELPDFAA